MSTKIQDAITTLDTLVKQNGQLIENQTAPLLEKELQTGKQKIAEAINGQGGDSTSDESLEELAKDVSNLHVQKLDLTGLKYKDGWEPKSVAEAIFAKDAIREIDDYSIVELNDDYLTPFYNLHVENITLHNCEQVRTYEPPFGENIKTISMPKCKKWVWTKNNLQYGGINSTALVSVNLPLLEQILYCGRRFISSNNIISISLPNLINYERCVFCIDCGSLKSISIPKFRGSDAFEGYLPMSCASLETLDISNCKAMLDPRGHLTNCPNLIDIICGKNPDIASFSYLSLWNPSNVLVDTDKTAILNENIRNHIAANLPDRTDLTSYTITFSQAVRNALETETEEAFTSKNWNISPTKTV